MKTTSVRTPRHFTGGLLAVGTVAVYLLAASSLVGCSKDAPPPPPPAAPAPPPPPPPPAPAPAAVAGVSLGKSVGPDKKISAPAETLGVKDTIYASVETTGVGKATLKATWTFTDKKGNAVPVHEDAQTVDLNGPATHEFHISKKTPWPKGPYNVEIFLNDVSAAKKAFSVN
jgi:hypothetical protein